VKRLHEEALALVAEALREFGMVYSEEPGTVRIDIDRGPSFTLRMAPLRGSDSSPVEPAPTLWVLRRPKRRELQDLRAKGQSFVALSGAVRIEAPGILIDRTDLKPPLRGTRPNRRSAFSDRASLIPRWLFYQPPDSRSTITGLAEATGVSASVASYAVHDLEQRQLVEVHASGRERRIQLVEHRGLIAQWAREYDWRDNSSLTVHAPIGSPHRFIERLTTLALPRYAVTLQAGASLLLPHAPVEQIHVYVDVPSQVKLSDLARRLDWPPNSSGRLHFLLPHYKTSVWESVREHDGVAVVSDLQLMLDLWNHPIRGREQAELLLEKHLLGLGST
jgi:MarR family protein/transcriptional regulator with AbiEi antitoxin domain of type IV toxin-antitoxin system